MRVCDKCSRDLAAGELPDCTEPDCPYHDSLSMLESEDKTLIDPEFDRDKVLAMLAAEREQEAAPGTEAPTALDQRPLDITKLYEEEDDYGDLPAFAEALLRESGDDGDSLRTSTATQAAPAEGTTTEQVALDAAGFAEALTGKLETDDDSDASESPTGRMETDDDVADSPTGKMGAMELDDLALSSDSEGAADDETSLLSPDDVPDSTAQAATVELSQSHVDQPTRDEAKTDPRGDDLKPTLSLADLRASLKNRISREQAVAPSSLEEQTEDAPADRTAEEDGTYDDDATALMSAAGVEDALTAPDAPTSHESTNHDATHELSGDDLLDFADELLADELLDDELLDDEGRTIEMTKDLAEQAQEYARSMSASGMTTLESPQPDRAASAPTIPMAVESLADPATVESLQSGAQPRPPQTYPQPQATPPNMADPYGSVVNQPPPPYGQGPSGVYGPPGYPPHPGQHPPPYDQQGPPQQLVPYEQQFLQEKPRRRIETFVIIAIVVLALIGVVLAVANFLR